MKKLFIVLIIGLCLWNQVSFVNAEGASLEVVTDKEELRINDTLQASIMAKDIEQVAGADILLYYDPSKLRLISKNMEFNEEEYIDIQDHIAEIKDENGIVRIIFGLKKDVLLLEGQEMLMASLAFEAIETGDAEITIADESRLVEEITTEGGINYQYSQPLLHISKTIVIQEETNSLGSIQGNVSLSDHGDIVGTEVILFQGDIEIKRTTVQENGTYTFPDLEDGNYTVRVNKPGYQHYDQSILIENSEDVTSDINLIRIKEDVNRDGTVDIGDLVVVGSRYGVIKGEEDWLADADLNHDEKIDLLDILFISRVLE